MSRERETRDSEQCGREIRYSEQYRREIREREEIVSRERETRDSEQCGGEIRDSEQCRREIRGEIGEADGEHLRPPVARALDSDWGEVAVLDLTMSRPAR